MQLKNLDRNGKIFFILIGIFPIFFAINIIRNISNIVFFGNTFSSLQTFSTALFETIAVILGIYAVFKLFQYYQKLRSPEFLVVAFAIYATGLISILWAFWMGRFTIFGGLPPSEEWVRAQFALFELPVFQYTYFLGLLAFTIHVIRTRSPSEWNIAEKIFIAICLYENIAILITFVRIHLLFYTEYYPNWFAVLFMADNLSISLLLPLFKLVGNDLNYFAIVPNLMTIFLLLYGYITIEPEKKTSTITKVQGVWIYYSTMSALPFLIITLIDDSSIFNSILPYFTTLAVIPLVYILIKYPEAFLITKHQIHLAQNLYEVMKRDVTHESTTMTRVQEYLHNLPDSVIENT